jgi:hypothetical protein
MLNCKSFVNLPYFCIIKITNLYLIMKSTSYKKALFATIALISLSCFIYVNTSSLDRTLQVESVEQAAEKVGQNAKMPDLTLFKSAVALIQTFFPAK